jgi:uncharacterized protein (TIGR03437 family)
VGRTRRAVWGEGVYLCAFVGFLALAEGNHCAFASGISLTSQVAAPGSSTLFPVVLTALDGPIGAVQFDLEYDNSAMSVIATLGDSSHNSAKSLYYVDLAPQIRRFFLAGMNESPITSGILLNLFINLQDNASGTYDLTLSNIVGSDPAGVLTTVTSMDATLTVQGTSNQGTALQPAGVLNLGSQLPGPVAPGELVTLIGSGIGPSSPVQPSGNTITGGASVLFDGTPAPILYAGIDEIQLVVPYEISGESATTMQVVDNGEVAATVSLPVAAASPALFTSDGSGVGQGAILNQDSTLNSPLNPASAGSIVAIYAMGAGQTNPPGVDGAVTGSALSTPVLPITVQIGGLDAQVVYAGSAPGLISGVVQINCLIPGGLSPGPALPVTLSAGTVKSAVGVTIALR